ncbi:hypothetical protein [Nitrospirillum iridis]|uniref:Uncharacterized protein n=1 Tax=Nitrospirillum iridis TaxID=765888 RepID=A0A7X0AUL2_9PROT|nr:hypothetical protein [Nitrospirillum iridis]MBB6250370.1 hypothetical protein [Nitrospirillum iridis]
MPHDLDALENRTLFCLWTGHEEMSDDRLRALWTIFRNTGCAVAFVNRDTLADWVKPDFPLHPAWPHLSATHKADYLRCYLMHHYGGGYTDIKATTKKWVPFFQQLAQSDALALGYQELPNGVAPITGELGDLLRASHADLIGLCAFIFRKGTPLTSSWLARTDALLDEKLDELRRHPAIHPLDRKGILLPDGTPSPYPLKWTELLGDIFHPLVYEFRERILQAPIAPSFASYR